MTCPDCEYHKNRAARWRAEAYKQAGVAVELPWKGLTNDDWADILHDFDYDCENSAIVKRIEEILKRNNT